jgi:hypothetical protein
MPWIVAAMLMFAFGTAAHATVTYEYTGIPFTYVQSPYTTDDFVSGTMTLNTALGPNLVEYFLGSAEFTPNGNLVDLTMSDGVQTIHALEACVNPNYCRVSTDASGNIVEWVLGAFGQGGDVITFNLPNCPECFPPNPMYDIVQTTDANGLSPYAQTTPGVVPGVWTTVIPEPSTEILMLIGLFALAGWRKVRA